MAKLLILGAGGFGQVVKEIAEKSLQFNEISFLDDTKTSNDVVGTTKEYEKFINRYEYAYPAFGDNQLRLDWLQTLSKAGYFLPTLIDSTAYISKSAKLGKGVVVLPKAVVNTNAKIGKACLINISAVIDHDAVIQDGVHICMSSVVKAGVNVSSLTKVEALTLVDKDI